MKNKFPISAAAAVALTLAGSQLVPVPQEAPAAPTPLVETLQEAPPAISYAPVGDSGIEEAAPVVAPAVNECEPCPGLPWTGIGQILSSLLVLAAGLYVILNKGYDETANKWAYGMVAMLLGFWIG